MLAAALTLVLGAGAQGWDVGPLLALPPQVGLSWRETTGQLAPTVALPWSAQFAEGDRLRPHRLILEPGAAFGARTAFYLRVGYRYVWHRPGARLGLGL